MDILERCTGYFLQLNFYYLALRSVPRLRVLNAVVRLCGLAWPIAVMTVLFRLRVRTASNSISFLVGIGLEMLRCVSCVVIVLEVALRGSALRKIEHLEQMVDLSIQHYLKVDVKEKIRRARIKSRIFLLLMVISVCDGLRLWAYWHAMVSPIFWYSLSIMQCLQMRMMQILLLIMESNERLKIVERAVLRLAAHNKPKSIYSSEIWMPYAVWEYDQINGLRFIYGRLHERYMLINDCYGWSILMLFQVSFVSLVSYAFWIFSSGSRYSYVFNSATFFRIFNLIAWLIWHADTSNTQSSYIGCLIAQLVKPLGNKRYNDLILEFSLQTMHQRFILSGKDFFNMNLGLMSSLVAAMVIYLVILLQFSNAEHLLSKQ